jgi:Asp-tRNA(Asn)/Glu-tRNA(Gln) amidotransferase A subunit family amidase
MDFDPQSGDLSRSRLSIGHASQLLRSKKVSPVELTQDCLRRIEQLNPKLNAFITVIGETALVDARRAEAEIQSGRWRGALHGIPIAIKDIVDTAGVRTTAASALFKDRIPPCGFTTRGLPIGMQISGPPWGEATVLRLANAYEQATEWNKRKPALI